MTGDSRPRRIGAAQICLRRTADPDVRQGDVSIEGPAELLGAGPDAVAIDVGLVPLRIPDLRRSRRGEQRERVTQQDVAVMFAHGRDELDILFVLR